MNEAIVKEEVIEETCNFTFKNGEYVEGKQEEIEQKPQTLLEKEIKTESIDSFENNDSKPFFEELEPKKESDFKIEKVSIKMSELKCTIFWKRMPRKLLKLVKNDDDKTVLSEIFKIEGHRDIKTRFVSHIQKIINENDGKLKSPSTPFEHLL
ncbi:unnamed protein product [Caenorhabditis nigoni]